MKGEKEKMEKEKILPNGVQELRIESEMFLLAREALNTMLKTTVARMVHKQNEEGSVTLKIDIKMEKTEDADYLPEGDPARFTPKIDCNVTSQIKMSEKLNVPADDAGHLMFDEEENMWLLVDGDPQLTIQDIFDDF